MNSRCRFGLFDFDFLSGELRREGETIKLPPQPTRVLALLLSRPGEVVLREQLRREIWGDDTFVDFERGLNFCIVQVRSALGDSSDNPRFIQTVPRRGYRFIAPVAVIPRTTPTSTLDESTHVLVHATSGAGPSGTPAEPSVPTALGPRPTVSRPDWMMWSTVAVIASVAVIGWLLVGERLGPAAADANAQTVRIAVLPFLNLTADPTADYLADGLTDELIAELGTVGGSRLTVIARTSAMAYRHAKKTVAEIGAELGVQYIVEGTVRRDGPVVRVTSSLAAVANQTSMARWDETFDTQSASPDTQQSHAAMRIARLVARELLPDATLAERQHGTLNSGAWEAFLQATTVIDRGTPDDVRRGIALLDSAVALDPAFAPAWARRAEAGHVLAMMGGARPGDAYPPVRDAAAEALALDATLASAHVAQGLVELWYNWRPREATQAFERALALNPSLAAAHHDYAWALVALGRADQAEHHMSIARDLDPLSIRANADVGWLHLHLRQPVEATRACQQTLALDARSLEAQACLERAYVQRGLLDSALQAARAATPSDAFVTDGRRGAAEQLQHLWRWRLARLEQASETRWMSPYTLAVQYVLVGETNKALDALEAAHRDRVGMMVLLARDPAMDSLRQQTRFESLLRRVNGTGS